MSNRGHAIPSWKRGGGRGGVSEMGRGRQSPHSRDKMSPLQSPGAKDPGQGVVAAQDTYPSLKGKGTQGGAMFGHGTDTTLFNAPTSWAEEMSNEGPRVHLDPEMYESPDGGVIPPGMAFPTVEALRDSIRAVEGASSEAADTSITEGACQPACPSTPTGVVIPSMSPDRSEASPGQPETLEDTDVADILESIVKGRDHNQQRDTEEESQFDDPAPSDVLVVTAEVKRIEMRVDDVVSEIHKLTYLISSMHEVMVALQTDNAAMATALSEITTELHRSKNLEVSIADQDQREVDRLLSTQILSGQIKPGQSIQELRSGLVGLSAATGEHSTSLQPTPVQQKPTLFRDY